MALSTDNAEILVVGYANVDVVARIPYPPSNGSRVTAYDISVLPGGMGANCACAAAYSGRQVVFFGNIGRDLLSDLLIRDFAEYGVNILYAPRNEETTVAIVMVAESGERTIISEPGVYDPAALFDFLKSRARKGQLLYVDGYHLVRVRSALDMAKAKGLITYCDLDGALDTDPVPSIVEALSSIDIVQWNPRIASRLFPDLSLDVAIAHLSQRVSIILTTDGANAVQIREGDREVVLPVPKSELIVDTTGAGDIFAGTFLSAYMKNGVVEDAVREAIRVATMSIRYPGARLRTIKRVNDDHL